MLQTSQLISKSVKRLATGCVSPVLSRVLALRLRVAIDHRSNTLGEIVITWDGDPDFPAQRAWSEELARYCDASEIPDITDHTLLCGPSRLRGLLEHEGFMGVRIWDSPFNHVYTPESFLALRTGLGTGRERFMSLSLRDRRAVLDGVRRRFDSMGPDDFVDRTSARLATALK